MLHTHFLWHPLKSLLNARGEHIHHGYFLNPTDTKELAQTQLIDLLLERSALSPRSKVVDVGCGIGGTSRYLAKKRLCQVLGITISGQQVRMARMMSFKEANCEEKILRTGEYIEMADGPPTSVNAPSETASGHLGRVRFEELDAENLGKVFGQVQAAWYDCVWISEALSHLPNKKLFFQNSFLLLKEGGKLVIADWLKADELTEAQLEADIKPIEGGSLSTSSEHISDFYDRRHAAATTVYPGRICPTGQGCWLGSLFATVGHQQ